MSVQRTEVLVRSTHLDSLGHVNNVRYLEYMEWGRVDWIQSYMGKFNSDISMVVVSIHINFRREVKLGARLTVLTGLVKLGNSSMTFLQEIVDENGQRIADAEVVAVLFDTRERRSRAIHDELRERLQKLLVETLEQ